MGLLFMYGFLNSCIRMAIDVANMTGPIFASMTVMLNILRVTIDSIAFYIFVTCAMFFYEKQ